MAIIPKVKLKALVTFPGKVQAQSPILLDRTGGDYSLSLDVNALGQSLAASATIDATNANNITSGLQTGTGAMVRATSPTLVTPALGTPSSVTLTNATGLPVASGVSGLGTGVATWLATPSSANLAAAVTGETGTGSLVFGTSPNITTPTGIVKGDVGLGNVNNVVQVATVKKQVFTASGTYTPSTGMLYCIIECVGGGGGGGGVAGTVSQLYQGGGGGSGGYSRLVATAATIGASKAVTIGTAGSGGASGANSGTAGGDTSVGTLCIGKGGSGGAFGSAAQVGVGGAGGVAGTGDLTAAGMAGLPGLYNSANNTIAFASGNGGSSYFGGGAPGVAGGGAFAGNNAGNYGSGGSGAHTNGASNAAGGNGSAGVVFITEFCSQ